MRNLTFLRVLLIAQTIGLLAYTGKAIQQEGMSLIQVFVSHVLQGGWSGQFNLDFMCYLVLSGLWIMWRDSFQLKSVFIGLIAMVLGIVFFAPYLLWLTYRENGDLKRVLLGSS